MLTVFAQIGPARSWGLAEFLIAIVVIGAAIALCTIAIRQFGIQIPAWLVQVFWICVVALVVIAAIRFVMTM